MEENFYNRGVMNSVIVAEAIRTAQKMTGKKVITGEDMRIGLENLDLTEARLDEIGLQGLHRPHEGVVHSSMTAGPTRSTSRSGTGRSGKRIAQIEPMYDVVRPMLEAAAADYVKDKSDWQTQTCN